MAECKECGKKLGFLDPSVGGLCSQCNYLKTISPDEVEQLDQANKDWENIQVQLSIDNEELGSVLLTTAHTLQDVTITQYLGVVSAECAYGMNMFKDMFANVRNLVGGRSAAVEDTMRDSRETVMQELKREAHAKGANAVIAVDLDYTQLGAGGNMMVLVSASGTAVVIEG